MFPNHFTVVIATEGIEILDNDDADVSVLISVRYTDQN